MPTYLLTWNPHKWPWTDLDACVHRVRNGEVVERRWSCGNTQKIVVGDRVFWLRQGKEPRGIFASGVVIEASYRDLHWDQDLASQGRHTYYIHARIDSIVNPEALPADDPFADSPFISRSRLKHDEQFDRMYWDTQVSGIRIREDVAGALAREWSRWESG